MPWDEKPIKWIKWFPQRSVFTMQTGNLLTGKTIWGTWRSTEFHVIIIIVKIQQSRFKQCKRQHEDTPWFCSWALVPSSSSLCGPSGKTFRHAGFLLRRLQKKSTSSWRWNTEYSQASSEVTVNWETLLQQDPVWHKRRDLKKKPSGFFFLGCIHLEISKGAEAQLDTAAERRSETSPTLKGTNSRFCSDLKPLEML